MKRVGACLVLGGLDGNEVEELEMNSIKLNGLDFPENCIGDEVYYRKEAKKKGYFLIEIRSRFVIHAYIGLGWKWYKMKIAC